MKAQEAKNFIENNTGILLDVRTQDEYDDTHIKGALLIPVAEINNRIGEIENLKNKELLVYCHSGGRSAKACQILQGYRFSNINNLDGGITSWINAGYDVE